MDILKNAYSNFQNKFFTYLFFSEEGIYRWYLTVCLLHVQMKQYKTLFGGFSAEFLHKAILKSK